MEENYMRKLKERNCVKFEEGKFEVNVESITWISWLLWYGDTKVG